jgi:hypothetical protein
MARPRKIKAVTSNPLLEALQFCSGALKDVGTPSETHIALINKWALANNGILAIGCPIPSVITGCPNYNLLIAALSKCGDGYSINPATVEDNTGLNLGLRIHSNKFKAIVPCIDPALIQLPTIDPPIAAINNEFRVGLEKVSMLANENAQHVVTASILMNGQSIVGTDRTIVIEYWHGLDLPPGLALPKSFAVALSKIGKNLKAFGCSNNSITIYFEDDSFIKTQLYNKQWPDINLVLNRGSNPLPVPKDLWEGVKNVESFSPDDLVHFDTNIIRSHSSDSMGASFEVVGLPKGPVFAVKYLKLIEPIATSIDFFAGNATVFFGDRIRGAIANRV